MDEVFSLIYFCNGVTHSEAWHMPIHMRKYYINKILQIKEKEKEAAESKTNNSPPRPPPPKK